MARSESRPLRARVKSRLTRAVVGPELDAHIRTVALRARIEDHVVFGDPSRVRLRAQTTVNDALFNVSSGTITVGDTAFFGHGVSLLTGTHELHERGLDRQTAIPPEGRDIVVERGAWISSNATVLGPCRIGAHAVVAAGSVVIRDVAPDTIVGGVQAHEIGRVPGR